MQQQMREAAQRPDLNRANDPSIVREKHQNDQLEQSRALNQPAGTQGTQTLKSAHSPKPTSPIAGIQSALARPQWTGQ
ncbi:MAG: hypothetical protein ACR2NK_09470 [Mariniblastus sp.]